MFQFNFCVFGGGCIRPCRCTAPGSQLPLSGMCWLAGLERCYYESAYKT